MMPTLFPFWPPHPPGFSYIEEFLSMQEEIHLIEAVRSVTVHPMIFQGYQAKRKVQSFGYDYHFDTRKLIPGTPIPNAFQSLIDKVAKHLSLPPEDFAELLVTEYPQGSVINWHRDAPPFDIIAGISLLQDCNFRFRPHDKSKQGRKSILTFPVKRRSLYILQQESRNDWEHSISPVKGTRYSITLRTLKKASG